MNSNYILEILKNSGVKITAPRREIIKILSFKPLGAHEIKVKLDKKGIFVDLVTIYRNLELFYKLKIVTKIQFEDKTSRYELLKGPNHHHHLVCTKCKNIEDIKVKEEKLIREIESESQFKIERHALEFFGVCRNCQI